MSQELRPSQRKGGLIVDVIIWAGISVIGLLLLWSLITHDAIFAWLALAVWVPTGVLGAATKRLFKERKKGQQASAREEKQPTSSM